MRVRAADSMKLLLILCICLYSVRCKPGGELRNDDIEGLLSGVIHDLDNANMPILNEAIRAMGRQQLQVSCSTCMAALNLVKSSQAIGVSSESLVVTGIRLCTMLGLLSVKACEGLIRANLPTIIHIFQHQPAASTEAFCSLILQDSGGNQCTHSDTRFEWSVELPARLNHSASQQVFNDRADDNLKIVFISDAHIDPRYEPGIDANCENPVCCRNESKILDDEFYASLRGSIRRNHDQQDMRFLSLTRRALTKSETSTGYWGHYGSCDSPIWAFDNIIEQIAANTDDIDFIYYTGDTVDHGVWETNRRLVVEMIIYVAEKLQSSFGDIPVFPTLGNHDTHAPNQYAPSYVSDEDINGKWLYKRLPDIWSPWLATEDTARTLRNGGFYTILARPGLRIIALNSNVAYQLNWWLVFEPEAPRLQLEWLVATLALAEGAGERVHILSHVPPGADMLYTWTREYNRIVNRFSHVIAAEFNGHSHKDEFKLFYNEKGTPTNVAFNGGSMTTYVAKNANYKIFYIDGLTHEALDVDTWIYNLTEANEAPDRSPNWFLEYSFIGTYQLPGLTPRDLDALIRRMGGDQSLLDDYVRFFGKSGDAYLQQPCDRTCKLDYLCRALTTVLWDHSKCFEYLGTNGKSLL